MMTKFNCLWQQKPEKFDLVSPDVHVWCASLDQDFDQIQQLRTLLAEDEQKRANRFYFQRDQWRFITARGTLRIILGQYLGIKPEDVQFAYGPYGKPMLAHPTIPKLYFNVSHANYLALYAIAQNREIGIDIEYMRPISDLEQLAKRFFSASEYLAIQKLPHHQQPVAFFNCWTRKEAYIKATGKGLTLPLNQFEVSVNPNEPAILLSTAHNPIAAREWTLASLNPHPDYTAAIAIAGKNWQLSCWQWN